MLIRVVLALGDRELQRGLEEQIGLAEIEVEGLTGEADSWRQVVRSCADVIVISDSMIPAPVAGGIGLLAGLPENPTIMVLQTEHSAELQAGYIAAGAHSSLYSGISRERMIKALEGTIESRRLAMMRDRLDRRGRSVPKISDFTTNSEVMQLFMNEVQLVAPSDSVLMIMGETGVGKEHLAKVIHGESPRASGPFVAVNTAALPEQLLESELFGHKQGAFTGATRSRRGAFEQAHGGTIFLDEIGEMPLHLQAKLLRVLQEYEIQPIGAEKSSWVDVRVIAATNKDLEQEVNSGNFRKDLYYRLSVIKLKIPPLRMRREDIPHLARRFVMDFKCKIGRDIRQIAEPAMAALCSYEWPGNIRELMNVIERSMLLSRSGEITMENLPSAFRYATDKNVEEPVNGNLAGNWQAKTLQHVVSLMVEYTEKEYLCRVLAEHGGSIRKTADHAGITTRSLYSKMRRYDLRKEDFKKRKRSL